MSNIVLKWLKLWGEVFPAGICLMHDTGFPILGFITMPCLKFRAQVYNPVYLEEELECKVCGEKFQTPFLYHSHLIQHAG